MSVSIEQGAAVIGTAAVGAVAALVATAGLCAVGVGLCARGTVWAVGKGVKAAREVELDFSWLNKRARGKLAELEQLLLQNETQLPVAGSVELASQFQQMHKRAQALAEAMPELSLHSDTVARYAALRASRVGQFARAEDWSAVLSGSDLGFNNMLNGALNAFEAGEIRYIRDAAVEAAATEKFDKIEHESQGGDKQRLILTNSASGQGLAIDLQQGKQGTKVKLDILSSGPDCQAQMQRILSRLNDKGIRLRGGQVTKHNCCQGVEVARQRLQQEAAAIERPLPKQAVAQDAPKRRKTKKRARKRRLA